MDSETKHVSITFKDLPGFEARSELRGCEYRIYKNRQEIAFCNVQRSTLIINGDRQTYSVKSKNLSHTLHQAMRLTFLYTQEPIG